MTNDPRVQTFHDYKFADYVQDQTEIAQLRTELDDLTGTSRKAVELMADAVAEVVTLRAQLAEVTQERDRLREAIDIGPSTLGPSPWFMREVPSCPSCRSPHVRDGQNYCGECGVRFTWLSTQPEPKPLTPADRVMIALAGRDKDDAERTLDKMYPCD